MSFEDDRSPAAVSDRRFRATIAGFVLLLLLAVLWPAPVLEVNDTLVHAPLPIDDTSFLGREAPSWDVAFWWVAILYTIAIFQGRLVESRDEARRFVATVKETPARIRSAFASTPKAAIVITAAGVIALTALAWLTADTESIRFAEAVRSDATRSVARLLNRLGGGMNPPMIIIFFALAGITTGRRWMARAAVAMALTAISGGILVHILKYVIGRSRPELWLGPFHSAGPPSTSFPSGHTIGAFSIAIVILFASRSRVVGIASMVIAFGVSASRLFAFRHWLSDVVAGALIAIILGWFFSGAMRNASAATGIVSDEEDDRRVARAAM